MTMTDPLTTEQQDEPHKQAALELRNQLDVALTRLARLQAEAEADRNTARVTIDDQTTRLERQQARLNELLSDGVAAELDRLRNEHTRLQGLHANQAESLQRMQAERAELDALVDRRQREVERLQEADVAFRKQVVDTAMTYARRHDWCSVVRSALEEMGLTVTTRYRVRVTVFLRDSDGWEAQRDDVYVTVESSGSQQAWRDVDAWDNDTAEAALDNEGLRIPDGWSYDRLDASTHDITEEDE